MDPDTQYTGIRIYLNTKVWNWIWIFLRSTAKESFQFRIQDNALEPDPIGTILPVIRLKITRLDLDPYKSEL